MADSLQSLTPCPPALQRHTAGPDTKGFPFKSEEHEVAQTATGSVMGGSGLEFCTICFLSEGEREGQSEAHLQLPQRKREREIKEREWERKMKKAVIPMSGKVEKL